MFTAPTPRPIRRSTRVARSRRVVVTALVSVALAAAGCSSDDAPASSPASSAPPASETSSRPATTAPHPTSQPARTAPTSKPTSTTTSSTSAPATTTTDVETEVDTAALQAILDAWRVDANTFGATLSIRLPGHDDLHLASGVDDRTITAVRPDGSTVEHTETPMTVGGTFQIAYITRTFVAAAVLQLVDEGRLAFDESVEPWLPELPNADQITTRMLLGYTSGLGQWDEADYTATLFADLARTYTPEEALAPHLAAAPVAAPGGDPSFGRAGYIALGLLIERVAGQNLATVIHDRFVEPLSLDDTVFTDGSVRSTRHGWFGTPETGGADRPIDPLDLPADAAMTTLAGSEAMVSSATDMLDWSEALFGGTVLGSASTATMLTMNPVSPPPVPNRYFGLGATGYCLDAGCDPNAAELVGAPGGGFCCWSTQLAFHRASGTTILVATNTNDPTPAALIQLVIDVVNTLGLE